MVLNTKSVNNSVVLLGDNCTKFWPRSLKRYTFMLKNDVVIYNIVCCWLIANLVIIVLINYGQKRFSNRLVLSLYNSSYKIFHDWSIMHDRNFKMIKCNVKSSIFWKRKGKQVHIKAQFIYFIFNLRKCAVYFLYNVFIALQ